MHGSVNYYKVNITQVKKKIEHCQPPRSPFHVACLSQNPLPPVISNCYPDFYSNLFLEFFFLQFYCPNVYSQTLLFSLGLSQSSFPFLFVTVVVYATPQVQVLFQVYNLDLYQPAVIFSQALQLYIPTLLDISSNPQKTFLCSLSVETQNHFQFSPCHYHSPNTQTQVVTKLCEFYL